MKKDKKKKNSYRSQLEGNESKLELALMKVIAIMGIIWLLCMLFKTGGRGYDHFIGEPVEYRMPLQRNR
jgi:hypothetical protein